MLTKFSEAAAERDWQLAWSVTNIIPEAALPTPQSWTPLGLRSPPVFATVRLIILTVLLERGKECQGGAYLQAPRLVQVLMHLRKLGEGGGAHCLSNWPLSGPEVKEVFGRILEHLRDQVGRVCSKLASPSPLVASRTGT